MFKWTNRFPVTYLIHMIFRQLFDAASSSYTYLLADPATRAAVLIDAVLEQVERDSQLVRELELDLKVVLDTHVHADHITGASALRDRFGCRLAATRTGGPACTDLHVGDGDVVPFGGYVLRVLDTPGHTAGCVSYLVDKMLFTGDALLVRTCGRTDFQGGDPGRLFDSVWTKLFTLPDDTLVYPGHDYKGHTVTSIGEEKKYNARLANRSREDFITLMNGLNLAMPKRINEALPANLECGCPQDQP
jgi:glyoxylase-like metal-dependent hydrolase (beta-lactamase superfamily II)